MDINKVRKDTIGCTNKIFLNSAGSSLMPKIVVEKMVNYINQEEKLGGYDTADKNHKQINEFYEEVAKLLNCHTSNIAFAYNATDAYAKALSSIIFNEGDIILTTTDDYVSNHIAFISLQKRLNLKVVRIKNLSDNEIDLEDLETLIKKHKPKLVAVTHIPTSSGLIQNIEGVGKICKMYDILYLVDACQSVGQISIDVQKIGCDFLTATGRKFLRGPRGTGFLYVSTKVLDSKLTPLFVDLRGALWTNFDDFEVLKDAKRFEHWEMSYSSLVGLTEAIRYANLIGLKDIEKYNSQLSNTLRVQLSENPKLKVLDKGNRLGSIITFCKTNGDTSEITNLLNENSVSFSISKKEYALIDFTNKKIDSAVRLSPHYFNTKEEIYKIVEILTKIK